MVRVVARRFDGTLGHVVSALGVAERFVARTVIDLRAGVDPNLADTTRRLRRRACRCCGVDSVAWHSSRLVEYGDAGADAVAAPAGAATAVPNA